MTISSFSISESVARAFLRRRDQPAGGELVEHLYRHVFAHAEAGKDRFRRPIGAERENAGVESVARPAGSDDPAVAQHLAFGVFKAAKRAQRFALPVAFGAGKADDLAAAHLEREIEKRGPLRAFAERTISVGAAPGLGGYSVSIGRPTINEMRSLSDSRLSTS